MESKKLKNVDQLCAGFRQKIESKKINPTIHPKLSWKLNDVSKMNEKNTKNFKFLDLQWYLEAKRDARGLQVRLYLSPLNGQDIELGVFYVKVLWTYP